MARPKKSDHTAMYLDREGKVKTVHFRMPEAKKKAKGAEAGDAARRRSSSPSRAPTLPARVSR